ncbi:MAG: autotransporter-associated beta strand repeat-containing protein [Kiritimatiellae bacterium]|nr:autotransporter-associated beta strand repeat-containing protein [Kiritimatiellia bacterium]
MRAVTSSRATAVRTVGMSEVRSAGRSLHEVIIFTRPLTDEERVAVYNYLDAKWLQGGWDTGAYNHYTTWGGPNALTFTSDTTVGTPQDASQHIAITPISVAEGATATFAGPTTSAGFNFTGGGTLDFAGQTFQTGLLTQNGGTLSLGGGTFDMIANPALTGDVRWENGTYLLNYYGEFRPLDNSTLTLGNGARVIKDCYWRTFIDKGVTLTLEAGSYMEVPGPMCVACDYATANVLNLAGGTLVVTNSTENNTVSANSLTIMTQQKNGSATLNMTSGRIVTTKFRVAADWSSYGTGVLGTGTVNVNGGAIETLDCVEVGSTHASKIGTAFLYFNGGEVTAPNGIRLFRDDHDTLVFNGTVFHATADCAKYLDFRKNVGSLTTLAAGGLPIDVAADKKVTLGWGLVGEGGLVKRGAGTLTLDKAASFEGGVVVEAGTLVLGDSAATGTGPITLAGASAKVRLGLMRPTNSLAGNAGTLEMAVAAGGRSVIMPVAAGFNLAAISVVVVSRADVVLPSAVVTVEDGMLVVTVSEGFETTLATGTSFDWYALPWTQGGVPTAFPTVEGAVVAAQIATAGSATVGVNQTVYSPITTFVNEGDAGQVVLAGSGRIAGSLNLQNFTGDVAVEGVAVDGDVAVGENSSFSFFAAAGEEWTNNILPNVLGGTLRKTGEGTVLVKTVPTQTIDSQAGVLAVEFASDATYATGFPVQSTTRTGAFEKRGAGTLTLTGGSYTGQFRVTEGTFAIAKTAPTGFFKNITATAEFPFYIGPNAVAKFDGDNNHTSRLPDDSTIVVDRGELILCGVNPFTSNTHQPQIFATNATVTLDHYAGSEHIKVGKLTLKDSTFRFTGTKSAVNTQGFVLQTPFEVHTSGNCSFNQGAGNPNYFRGDGNIKLIVEDGVTVWSILTKPGGSETLTKSGAGALRFGPGMAGSTMKITIDVRSSVENGVAGGICPNLAFNAGAVLRAVDGAPLEVTTLTMPTQGSVTLDLSGIDFANRTEPLTVLTCAAMTSDMASRFDVVGMPGAPWTMSMVGGITLQRVSQPQTLTWNTGSGDWTSKAWNNDPSGYGMDGYHKVRFADCYPSGATAPSTSLTTVTVPENRTVVDFDMKALTTPYCITGGGLLTMPSFVSTGTAGWAIETPIRLMTGGIIFGQTSEDQILREVQGTIGTINIPAAGGLAFVGFADSTSIDVGAISIGSGKTLHLHNGRSSGMASPHLNGVITGDRTTRLRITSGPGLGHFDVYNVSPNFNGNIEVADGGFLYFGSSGTGGYRFDFTSSAEDPVWIHGTGSAIRFYSSANSRQTCPLDAHFLVTDGGLLQLCGVNPQGLVMADSQQRGPSIVVSNATFQAQDVASSHIHVRDVVLKDKALMQLSEKGACASSQGLMIWGKLIAAEGTSTVNRVTGNPNSLLMGDAATKTRSVEGTIEVREGSTLRVENILFDRSFHKTGTGTLLFAADNAFAAGSTKTIYLDEGWMVVNEALKTANANFTTVRLSGGVGFDLREEENLPWTPSVVFTANVSSGQGRGKVKLNLGPRKFKSGDLVLAWNENQDLTAVRSLAFTEASGQYSLSVTSRGVEVSPGIAILLR